MNEQRMANKIKQYLNLGLNRIDQDTLTRLQKARGEALSRYKAHNPALGLAWAGSGSGKLGQHLPFNARLWLPVAALLLAVASITYWQTMEQNGDAAEIDTALLADDLPVHAYIDTRFDAWLRRSQQ